MKTKKGFTLIELLVVIAIIGLLATLGVIAFRDAQRKGRDTKRVADIHNVVQAFATANNDGKVLCNTACNAAPGAAALLSAVAICTPGTTGDCTNGAAVIPSAQSYINLTNLNDPLWPTGAACTGAAGTIGCNYAFTGVATVASFSLNFATERTDVAGLAAQNGHTANQNGVTN
jgi:prepilin-type N-terminal cleavage/methylation domain-containing protein